MAFSTRDSIIPLGGEIAPNEGRVGGGGGGGPDYKNIGYDEDGQLNIDGELVPKTHSYENQIISGDKGGGAAGGAVGGATFVNQGIYDPDMDYMNQDPEGLFHTYSNQDDLLQQVSKTFVQFKSIKSHV